MKNEIENYSNYEESLLDENNLINISKDFSDDFNFPNFQDQDNEKKIHNLNFQKLSLKNLQEKIEIEFEKKKINLNKNQYEIYFSDICKSVLPFFKGNENKIISTIFLTILFISNEKNLIMNPTLNKDFKIIFN